MGGATATPLFCLKQGAGCCLLRCSDGQQLLTLWGPAQVQGGARCCLLARHHRAHGAGVVCRAGIENENRKLSVAIRSNRFTWSFTSNPRPGRPSQSTKLCSTCSHSSSTARRRQALLAIRRVCTNKYEEAIRSSNRHCDCQERRPQNLLPVAPAANLVTHGPR